MIANWGCTPNAKSLSKDTSKKQDRFETCFKGRTVTSFKTGPVNINFLDNNNNNNKFFILKFRK